MSIFGYSETELLQKPAYTFLEILSRADEENKRRAKAAQSSSKA